MIFSLLTLFVSPHLVILDYYTTITTSTAEHYSPPCSRSQHGPNRTKRRSKQQITERIISFQLTQARPLWGCLLALVCIESHLNFLLLLATV